MKVYMRKIDNQCINKQISILSEVAEDFFDGVPNGTTLNFIGATSNKHGEVTVLYATDPRLGGDIKQLITAEGGMNIDDLLVIRKGKNAYMLEIIKKDTDLWKQFISFFNTERHLLLYYGEENKEDFNVFGIHMKLKNTALDEEYPHICIGWSYLGDLTNITSKDELKALYISKTPNCSNNKKIGAQIGQIWLFKNEMKINDYIIYFDGATAHFGRIVGDYEYIENIENQDSDYINNRKVNWIKDIPYKDLPLEYRKSAMSQRSVFKLNSFKPLIDEIINKKRIERDEDEETDDNDEFYDFFASTITSGENLIVYGTPGCGKSYYVQHELLKDYDENNYIRTTFFQDYTNTDFVGQILPIVDGEKVTYKFNPGPFALALKRAIEKPNEKVALVIEELNRGSAASIFGDIFQLLDRNKENGVSEYPIENINLQNYLNDVFLNEGYKFNKIRLPGNLFIYATMNTSDQNVFVLDTAFKRRWKFYKLDNKFKSNHAFKDFYVPGMDYTWKELVETINEYMLNKSGNLNSEDKQIGVYFVDDKGMRKEKSESVKDNDKRDFAYKVLEYLWDDVAKFDRGMRFDDKNKSLDELVEDYVTNGVKAFSEDFQNELRKKSQ